MMFNSIINQEKVTRTFVIEKEDTQQSTILDYSVRLIGDRVNIKSILDTYCPTEENKVSIYDPSVCKFVSLAKMDTQNGCLSRHLFQPAVVMLRFIQKGSVQAFSESFNSDREEVSREQKECRSRERTIGQVIEVVKQWRNLHLHGHKSLKKRLNLQDAAKIVGISKKSLDDYYCQLRLGELYHYDYINNLDERMGALRGYVKNYRPEKHQTIRRQNDKHPKNLKIIDYYDISSHGIKNVQGLLKQQQYIPIKELAPQGPCIHLEQIKSMQSFQMQRESIQLRALSDCFNQEQGSACKQLFNLQHDFFKQFQMQLDQKGDPYYDAECDFRKKDFDYESNSFMFL